jgi:hypothetical protein
MPRAQTKEQLISYTKEEKEKLYEYLKQIKELDLEDKYVFDNRKPKDIVAHLVAWHKLMDNWYTVGMKGEKPEIPAPGYTFKDSDELNEKLFQDYKDIGLEEILKEFEEYDKKLIGYVKKHTNEDLYTKKKYKWTGTTSIGSYMTSALSSHYVWGNELLRKFIKRNS